IKVFTALGDYSGDRGTSFAAWISRIAVNTCYDALRRVQRRPERLISELSEDEAVWLNSRLRSEGAGDDIEMAAIARDLSRKLLSRLNPEDRLVLTLLDVEGLSMPEIAAAIGWTVPKVKVRAYRARISLRKILCKYL
ncbi:MAG: RNA polymerase sigma factor, partial [Pyrinomonadaceae bacterium]